MVLDDLENGLGRRAVPSHDGEQRVKHLLLAGVVTFPSRWSLLPHGEINFKSELCLLVFVCWACITTAHKDGSIPLNSQWVIDHFEKADLNQDMLAQLLRRANTQPDLLEALEYLTTHTPERHNEGPSLIPNPDWAAWVHKARAAIIKATA